MMITQWREWVLLCSLFASAFIDTESRVAALKGPCERCLASFEIKSSDPGGCSDGMYEVTFTALETRGGSCAAAGCPHQECSWKGTLNFINSSTATVPLDITEGPGSATDVDEDGNPVLLSMGGGTWSVENIALEASCPNGTQTVSAQFGVCTVTYRFVCGECTELPE